MSLSPGQVLDAKYRIIRLLGTGGMGTVYEGENVRIGRRVAIKVLNAQVAALSELTERFQREARVAAKVGSKHVCDVLDLGDLPNGDHYLVMELLEGQNIEDRLLAGRIPQAELVTVAMELLDGLGTMHQAGVIHRDLKPANVFLARTTAGRGEMVKILDFGVAKLEGFGPSGASMTRTGAMIGTPLYMSPEQARGARDVDARTDLYAASVIFYRALTGQLPHVSENLNELLFKVVLEDARPLRDLAPEVDAGLAAIIHKGLARELDERFASARAYQDALAAWSRAQGLPEYELRPTLPTHPPPAMASPELGTLEPSAVPNSGTPVAWVDRSPSSAGRPEISAPRSGSAPDPARGPSSVPPELSVSAATGIAETQASATSPVASRPPVVRVSAAPGPGHAAAEPSGSPKSSRTGLYVGGAVAVALVAWAATRNAGPTTDSRPATAFPASAIDDAGADARAPR